MFSFLKLDSSKYKSLNRCSTIYISINVLERSGDNVPFVEIPNLTWLLNFLKLKTNLES